MMKWKCLLWLVFLTSCSLKKQHNEKEKAILGQYLFFDTRLSLNNTKSCASCHNPNFAFSDGYRTSITSLGENVLHNAPSIINSSYLKKLDWANPNITSLTLQIKRPLYAHQPIELGLDQHFPKLKITFEKDSLYNSLFKKAFPNDDSLFTKQQIEDALIAYEKTLTSNESNYDKGTLTVQQLNGLKLFSSKQLNCVVCHPPPNFTLATTSNHIDSIYINIGLYNINNNHEYPKHDAGLSMITNKAVDNGKFKIPSLRNVLLTAPYMHDGSLATISEVIDMYARGGRWNKNGDGKLNKNKHPLIKGFTLNEKEKMELISFLSSLTDSTIFKKPQFKNPFH
jgi:cytochrome c peroxidase